MSKLSSGMKKSIQLLQQHRPEPTLQDFNLQEEDIPTILEKIQNTPPKESSWYLLAALAVPLGIASLSYWHFGSIILAAMQALYLTCGIVIACALLFLVYSQTFPKPQKPLSECTPVERYLRFKKQKESYWKNLYAGAKDVERRTQDIMDVAEGRKQAR